MSVRRIQQLDSSPLFPHGSFVYFTERRHCLPNHRIFCNGFLGCSPCGCL